MKEVLAKAESKMNKTIQKLEGDYAAIRAGRANPAVLDKVTVDYYGAPTSASTRSRTARRSASFSRRSPRRSARRS